MEYQLEITNVAKKAYEGGIQLADLDSVREAITIFAGGGTRGSQDTEQRLIRDGGEKAIMGLALAAPVLERNRDPLVERLLQEISARMEVTRRDRRRGELPRFSKSYDYDGMGTSFFKTTVEVSVVEYEGELVYLLHLNAAYVGDKPTAGLAESLQATRALWRTEVLVTCAPNGDNFEFDFGHISERLATVEGLTLPSGNKLAGVIMEGAQKRDASQALREDGLVVSISPVYYSVGKPASWQKEGAVISGPLETFGDEVQTPRLVINVSLPQDGESSFDRKPIVDPTTKGLLNDQADAIVVALS